MTDGRTDGQTELRQLIARRAEYLRGHGRVAVNVTALRRLWHHLPVLGLVILAYVPVCAVVVAVCQLLIQTIIIIIIIIISSQLGTLDAYSYSCSRGNLCLTYTLLVKMPPNHPKVGTNRLFKPAECHSLIVVRVLVFLWCVLYTSGPGQGGSQAAVVIHREFRRRLQHASHSATRSQLGSLDETTEATRSRGVDAVQLARADLV